ncbi:MAG: tRNA 2-thiocytidine(32) synthetase TtcA [Gammaproteobacteria bacterium]|nr:tRNA 2-thiocytidine(32) synthetase TtcA [Gammaproteobacteria bacterium]
MDAVRIDHERVAGRLDRRQSYEFNKLQKRLRRNAGRAIDDFNMIGDGDRVMVCLSGGADSYTLLDILMNLRRNAPVAFELVAVNLDQKQPGFPEQVLPRYLQDLGIPFHILERDTYSVVRRVVPQGDTLCGLCSRLRRGILYAFAREQGYTRIALGHHREDIMETLFLNLFYGGKLKGMPAKLLSDDGDNVVIRPLAYCKESDIKSYARIKGFPIIPCKLCGSQDNLQRQAVKQLLHEWNRKYPGRIENIFSAMQNLVPSHLLDRGRFNFAELGVHGDGGSRNAEGLLDN